MNSMKLALVTLLLLPAVPVGAQDDSAPLSAPGKSANAGDDTDAKLQTLFKLAGKWKIEEQYPPNEGMPKGATGKGEARINPGLNDTALIGDYRSRSKAMDTNVSAHVVFAYDSDADHYIYFWFDNYGHAYRFVGKYDGRSKSFVFSRGENSEESNGIMAERHTYHIEDDDHVVFTMEFQTGPNAYELALTTQYTRKGATAKKSIDEHPELSDKAQRPKRSRGMIGR